MKVALINNFPPYSGTGRYPYQLWQTFKSNASVQADLFCTHAMTCEEYDWPVNQGVKFLHKKPYKEDEWGSRFDIYFKDAHRIPKKYDLYHITCHMLGHFVPRLHPCVVTIHDLLQFKYPDSFANPFVSLVYNQLLRRSLRLTKQADKIVCVSNWTRSQVIKNFQLDASRVATVYNGVDHDLFKPNDREQARSYTSLPKDRKIILHVGSETKRKNIPCLLKILDQLLINRQDVILVRIGEKTEDSSNMIEKLRLRDRVFYFSNVPEDRLPLYYQAADLMILPSFDEGFGFPLVEAMSCGIPVLTTNKDPMLEVVSDAGMTADPKDPKEFANKANQLLNNKDLWQKMSAAGLIRSQDFSWQKAADQLAVVYQQVLAEKH